MENTKAKISSRQLTFCFICLIQGSVLLTAFVVKVTKQDSWIAVILSYLLSLPVILLYFGLINRFPGKNLNEIFEITLGKILGRVVSVFYILFFLTLTALNLKDVGNFVVGFMMVETPLAAITIMFAFICILAVRKGPETITRYSLLFGIIGISVMLINALFLLPDMDFSNYLPILTQKPIDYIHSAHTITSIPILETVALFMIFPSVKEPLKVKKSFFWGVTVGAVLLLIIILRDTAVLGPTIEFFSLPSFEAIRLVNIGDIISRMEILFAVVLLMLLFFKVCILFYATVACAAHVLQMRTYIPLTFTLGAILICYSLITFSNAMENAYWGGRVAPFFNNVFQIVFPLIVYIVALIRGLRQKPEVDNP